MAFVTYILLAAFHSGLQDRFHPEILGYNGSAAIMILLLELVLFKAGCYLLGVQGSGPVIDLIAYAGYKFIGYILLNDRLMLANACYQGYCYAFSWIVDELTITLPCNLYVYILRECLLPSEYRAQSHWNAADQIYARICIFYAQLRSLRSVVLPEAAGAPASVGTVSHAQRSRRITFLFLAALIQIVWMGMLVKV